MEKGAWLKNECIYTLYMIDMAVKSVNLRTYV